MKDDKQIMIRLNNNILKKAKILADLKDVSLNKYLNEIIIKEVNSIFPDEKLKELETTAGVNDGE